MSRINRHQYPTVLFSLILITGLISSYFLLNRPAKNKIVKQISMPVILVSQTPLPTPSVAPLFKKWSESQPSIDGSIELIVEYHELPNSQVSNSIFVKNKEKEKQLIFTQDLIIDDQMKIPFNTWSPDETHFFIEKQTPIDSRYLVFKTSGEQFKDGLFLDVNEYFNQKEIPFAIDKVTGWAAPGLLLVTTLKDDQTKGPSYWFEINSLKFIQLSTQF